jgi:hypothetical protein
MFKDFLITVQQDLENLSSQVVAICSNFERQLLHWETFDDCLIVLQAWLVEAETLWLRTPPLKTSIEDKRTQLHHYEVDARALCAQDFITCFSYLDTFWAPFL